MAFNLSFKTNVCIITYQPGPTNEDEGGDGEDETTAGGALVVFFSLIIFPPSLVVTVSFLMAWHKIP